MTGVAVNVTEVPEQMDEDEATMLTEGVTGAVTIMLTVFEVAVCGLAQARLDVMTTVTASPLASVLVWKLLLFVPAFTAFTFH